MRARSAAVAAMILSMLMPEPAWAAHGKAGTWEVTSQVEGFATKALLQIVRLFPKWSEALSARRVHFGDDGRMTMRYCMTAEQVKRDQPLLTGSESCHSANLKVQHNRLSADVACNGRLNGHGQLNLTFDRPEHYHGQQIVIARLGVLTITRKMTIDGRWIAADCKGVP